MKRKNYAAQIIFVLFLCFFLGLKAQLTPNIYHYNEEKEGENIHHELKIDHEYFVYTVYKKSPAKFIKTLGGFYTTENGSIKVPLEFNSNYENDSITKLNVPYSMEQGNLVLYVDGDMEFEAGMEQKQDLDGKWLMAGRVTEEGEKRRDTNSPRKTMKFLMGGHFQWIAFNTETFQFFGTGGGIFTSKDNVYIEDIHFFSRDNTKVGNALSFTYKRNNDDWYHSGKSSKGDPLHEIWTRRK